MKKKIIIFIASIGGVIALLIDGSLVSVLQRVVKEDTLTSGVSKIFSATTIKDKEDEYHTRIDPLSIVEETNKVRVENGLTPLAINSRLVSSAEAKVKDMVALQYFEHDSPTGESVSDLGKRAGYDFVVMGENLALGDFDDAKDIVTAWMNSPGHRANILSQKYQEIGVSVVFDFFEGKKVWIAVQHFGSSRDVCPAISNSLKKEIDSLNTLLKQEEGEIVALRSSLQAPDASSRASYQTDVSRFNAMVDIYNKQLVQSRILIEKYNEQVRSFNRCIATFQ